MSANGDGELGRIHDLTEVAARAAQEAPGQEPMSQGELVMKTMFGGYFNPQQFSWSLVPGNLNGTACHFLAFEHAHGRFCIPLASEEMMTLGKALLEKASGIIVATN
jgi:hypothetical protein